MTTKNMVIDTKPISMVSSMDTNLEIIDLETSNVLSSAELVALLNESANDNFGLLESTSKDEDIDVGEIVWMPCKSIPFKEKWLPIFYNLGYKLVEESLYIIRYLLLLEKATPSSNTTNNGVLNAHITIHG